MHRPVPKIILGSASPRRKELFEKMGIPVTVMPSSYEEILPMPLTPWETVMFLSMGKGLSVANALGTAKIDGAAPTVGDASVTAPAIEDIATAAREDILIVSSDTIVWQGHIMGKPKNREEAFAMLTALSGAAHKVYTGYCLLAPARGIFYCDYDVATVHFTDLPDTFLDTYLATDEPYDKAGAYAVQGSVGRYVDRIDGDKDTVIGFPMKKFLAACDRFAVSL